MVKLFLFLSILLKFNRSLEIGRFLLLFLNGVIICTTLVKFVDKKYPRPVCWEINVILFWILEIVLWGLLLLVLDFKYYFLQRKLSDFMIWSSIMVLVNVLCWMGHEKSVIFRMQGVIFLWIFPIELFLGKGKVIIFFKWFRL